MVKDMNEIGSTGLRAANGIVSEEILPALRGDRGRKTLTEMAEDPIISGTLLAWEKILQRLEWRVESPAKGGKEADRLFIEQCFEDMSESWPSTLSSLMTMTTYGWSFHELVYKQRLGPDQKDPAKRSKFNDGRIGWRKWPIRSQLSLQNWVLDEDDGIQAMVQRTDTGKPVVIPMEKALLFRTTSVKGNPEGRPLIRAAYRPWYFKKRIEELEAIGMERDLAGLPVARIDTRYFSPNASGDERALLATMTDIVGRIKRNEAEGLVFPVAYDGNGNKLIDFELMSSGGARQFDMDAAISRYGQQIVMSMLADFIMLGHENVGSKSLGSAKIDLWMMAVEAMARSIAEVVNRHAIPRLMKLNGMSAENPPQLVFGSIDSVDLGELGTYIKALSDAGAITLDHPLEDYLRDIANLPPADEEAREEKEEMFANLIPPTPGEEDEDSTEDGDPAGDGEEDA